MDEPRTSQQGLLDLMADLTGAYSGAVEAAWARDDLRATSHLIAALKAAKAIRAALKAQATQGDIP